MASSSPKLYTIFLFLSLALLLLFFTREVAANLCQRKSTTWSGPCLDTGNCKNQCLTVEHATFGACHRDGFGFACFCYFNC
ncbi:defensin-like protein 1 [Cicer arietinum]|uniref:Defensin-like protein 1 n=1 Tax=Cicer arietinum TaxID=3827 RepID=A0A3Q7XFY6_CICAR|nr:defensin-like protein 1 [Cicer arietinum]